VIAIDRSDSRRRAGEKVPTRSFNVRPVEVHERMGNWWPVRERRNTALAQATIAYGNRRVFILFLSRGIGLVFFVCSDLVGTRFSYNRPRRAVTHLGHGNKEPGRSPIPPVKSHYRRLRRTCHPERALVWNSVLRARIRMPSEPCTV